MMRCVGCGSAAVSEQPERTAHGYSRFRCPPCAKQCNERSGGLLNRTQFPCRCHRMRPYNTERTHQGRWCYATTPMQTSVAMLPVARKKLLQAA